MTQPKLITKPFASDALPGYVNEIPKENPSGAPEQNASWAAGFPPITMTDLADGGLPPNGEDMNGVLRAITEHNLFIGGGGVYKFTSEYVSEVGGYSKGAVLISDDKTALWMSIQDNNTQNFNGATKTQWRRIAFTDLDLTLSQIQGELDDKVGLSGDQTVSGTKKFTSFPVTPSDVPTDNYQAANKKYVDDVGESRVKWVSGDKIITVADSGADFTTVMSAIAEAMKWRSIDGSVIVEIQSGYLVKEQLFFIDNDYSHINIKAQNGATIIVDHNSMSVTDFEGLGESGFILCARGKSPMFQTQFEFLTRPVSTISGAMAVFGGEIYFGNNSGVKGAGANGVFSTRGSSVNIGDGNDFSGAGVDGVIASRGGSAAMGDNNDFSGSGSSGASASRGGSLVVGDGNNFSGTGGNGASASRGGSLVVGSDNNFSGTGGNGASASRGGSLVVGDGNNFSGVSVGNYSLLVTTNGFIRAGDGTIFTVGRERSQAAGTITTSGLIMG